MAQGKDPRQKLLAASLVTKAQLALEHQLPKGTTYVVILQGDGFNTYAANVDKHTTLHLLHGLVSAVQDEVLGRS